MVKQLYLVRHAKSLHDPYVLSDPERHLAPRGYADAAKTAAWLLSRESKLECIISSPAIRAYSTAFLIASAMAIPTERIVLNASIYEGTAQGLLYLVNELPDQFNSVMMVGHNPGFTELINVFCGTQLTNLPTAACAVIRFETPSWSAIAPGTGSIENLYSSHKDIF